MEYNAITKTCTDAGIRALLFIRVGCVLYVWNKVFETNVGHVSYKLDKKEEGKKKGKLFPWKYHAPVFGDKSQQLLQQQIKFYL